VTAQSGFGGKSNCLKRAAHYLKRAAEFSIESEPSLNTFHAWARVLEVPDSTGRPEYEQELQTAVMERLLAIRADLTLARKLLLNSIYPPDIYSSAFDKALMVTSGQYLALGWSSIRQLLTEDVVSVLRLCATAIGDEEREIAVDELEAIIAMLSDLEAVVSAAELDADVKSLFYDQIAILRRALREYPVRGAQAIRQAFYIAVGEWYDRNGDSRASKAGASKLAARFNDVMVEVQRVLALAKTGESLIAGAPGVIERIGNGIDAVRRALTSGS